MAMARAPHNATPATLPRRLGAMLYDGLLLCALLLAAAAPVVILAGGAEHWFIRGPWFQLYLYAVGFVFFAWCWVHGGQTLGLQSWRLRVVRRDGGNLGWRDAALRYLGATVSLGALGLGFIAILLNPQRLAWHDRLSRTRVVYTP